MSKGSGRRPAAVDEQTLDGNWAATFGERQRDQKWVEDTRAAYLAAANMVTPAGSQKDWRDGQASDLRDT